jgi:putative membrane protein
MMGGYGGYGGYGGSWLGMGMMWFFGVVLLIGVVLMVVWIVRMTQGPSGHASAPAPGNDPCNIAKVRYAKGEITKEQYDEICRTLSTS